MPSTLLHADLQCRLHKALARSRVSCAVGSFLLCLLLCLCFEVLKSWLDIASDTVNDLTSKINTR